MKIWILCVLALSVASPMALQAEEIAASNTKLDVIYKTIDKRSLGLDLHYPAGFTSGGKLPFVLFTHGGGWAAGKKTIGDRGGRYEGVKALNELGFCVASVQYRLCKKDSGITMRDCVTDAKDALRFLVKNAEQYSLDPNRIFTWGDSAGGHLAQMVLLSPPESFPGDPALVDVKYTLTAGVSWYGPSDFEKTELFNPPGKTGTRDRFGPRILGANAEGEDKTKAYREISPVNYLRKDSPPLLMMSGDNDTTIPVHHILYMKERADAIGAPVEIYIVENCAHNWREAGGELSPSRDMIFAKTAAYLKDHLDRRATNN